MNENRFIYAAKLIACFAVITIHAKFPGVAGEYWLAVARFAVPFFFAVSGRYLLAGTKEQTADEASYIRKRTGRALSKLCRNTAIVYSVYLIFSFVYHLVNGISVKEWFQSKFNVGEAVNFIMFNSGKFIYDPSYTFDHLWFLFALIYVYVLIFIFAKVLRKWYRALIGILLFFLYFGELLQTYYPIRPFGINICTWYVMRNWLFVGMPFVLIGILFADHIEKQKRTLDSDELLKVMENRGKIGILLLAAGIVSSMAEYAVWGVKEVYFGSLLVAVSILFLSESKINTGKIIWKLGKIASNNTYYFHVLILTVIDLLVPMAYWLRPIIIFVVCMIMFYVIPVCWARLFHRDKPEH